MIAFEKLIHTPEGKLEVEDPFLRVGTKVRTKDRTRRSHYNEGEITEACLAKYEVAPIRRDSYVYIQFVDHPTPITDNRANLEIVG